MEDAYKHALLDNARKGQLTNMRTPSPAIHEHKGSKRYSTEINSVAILSETLKTG